MYSIYNERKSVLAEEFLTILKNKIYKYMTSVSKNVCIDKLDDIVNKYNNTYLKRTNFRVDLFSRVQKNCILRVLIFANGRFQKSSRVLIFANPLELSFGYGQLFKFKIKFETSR